MGGGPAPPPRYNRGYEVNGQGGSRLFDGAGNRTGFNQVYDTNCFGYRTSGPGSGANPMAYNSDVFSNFLRNGTDARSKNFGLGSFQGGQGGGDGEAGTGFYNFGPTGVDYSTTFGPIPSSPTINTLGTQYRVAYYSRGTGPTNHAYIQAISAGGGGWGAAGGSGSGNFVGIDTPRSIGVGGAGGNAIKTNNHTLTVSSGSTRIFGSIVS